MRSGRLGVLGGVGLYRIFIEALSNEMTFLQNSE